MDHKLSQHELKQLRKRIKKCEERIFQRQTWLVENNQEDVLFQLYLAKRDILRNLAISEVETTVRFPSTKANLNGAVNGYWTLKYETVPLVDAREEIKSVAGMIGNLLLAYRCARDGRERNKVNEKRIISTIDLAEEQKQLDRLSKLRRLMTLSVEQVYGASEEAVPTGDKVHEVKETGTRSSLDG